MSDTVDVTVPQSTTQVNVCCGGKYAICSITTGMYISELKKTACESFGFTADDYQVNFAGKNIRDDTEIDSGLFTCFRNATIVNLVLRKK